MRVSKEKAAQNRERILTSAARLFREHGIDATGVDAITEDAGLTHGGLYSQFGSKEVIAVEAIRFALARGKRVWQRALERNPGMRALPAIVDGYLSRAHRDAPGTGCVLAALGPDIARQPRRVRQAFTREIKDDLEFLSRLMPDDGEDSRYEDAIATFASMAGALILARAVNDEELSDLILKSTAKRVIKRSKPRRALRRS
jgi:TetR/AcrR family transcriptional repressor of nem operon